MKTKPLRLFENLSEVAPASAGVLSDGPHTTPAEPKLRLDYFTVHGTVNLEMYKTKPNSARDPSTIHFEQMQNHALLRQLKPSIEVLIADSDIVALIVARQSRIPQGGSFLR